MKTLCMALALVAGGWVSAAQGQVNIAVDIDSSRTSGTATGASFTTQAGFTSWDLTDVIAAGGSTTTIDGVTFEVFGFAGENQSRVRSTGTFNDLTADFVFNEGSDGAAIGLRITGLPIGIYDVQSWHFDSLLTTPEATQVEIRNQGEPPEVTLTPVTWSQEPLEYLMEVTSADQVRELIFREASDGNRARLNGFTIQTIPEPSTLALAIVTVLGVAAWRRRGNC